MATHTFNRRKFGDCLVDCKTTAVGLLRKLLVMQKDGYNSRFSGYVIQSYISCLYLHHTLVSGV